jgi:hypothetical protein
MKIKKLLTAFIFSIACSAAFAQTVTEAATASLQAQIGRDDTGFNNCGVRAVVMDGDAKLVEAYDFSIHIRSSMSYGLLKAGKMSGSMSKIKGPEDLKMVLPAPIMFWVAEEKSPESLRMLKIIPADTKGFILGSGDLLKSYQAIIAIATGQRMQFATRYANQSVERVMAFSAKLSDQEREALSACLDNVIARMRSQAKGEAEN